MKKYIDGKYIDLTQEEMEELDIERTKAEVQYWANVDYDTAVEAEIAKRYTVKQELAIQRQKDEKPEEFEAYYTYCEECKAYVKSKKGV